MEELYSSIFLLEDHGACRILRLTYDTNRTSPDVITTAYRKMLITLLVQSKRTKRTAAGIPTWSPTVVLICRSTAYVWQSGRDAQFSADCGRTYLKHHFSGI
ncbi:uncharacterized protein M437DRAFT_53579 [Aureobasidium melanogenum CBS 110374]|uniref:Uncharacterized protein n=1 Tax=Aureobasidium melanogenum (strain CBS 110374) TaxID=1043003 RepID=A0A074VSJ0_AURM1|nr:uncharacterized protein M437DRAFT_53579 [Aureobasidium melanogenum CBS 110374]KEQ60657.1 hypothetical protein M437DRAFT_53579 [Aureobasidium melanogenum CBS 110374]